MVRRLSFTLIVLGIFALAGSSSAMARHGCNSYWGGGYGTGYYSYRPSVSFQYGYYPNAYGYYGARMGHYGHRGYYGYRGHHGQRGHHGHRGHGGHGGVHFSYGF